jgi:carbon-monoxide dehydrogenase large subunit
LTLWAARRVGRPVKWIATRSEVFLSDHQARDHYAEAALALAADGRFWRCGSRAPPMSARIW